MTRKKTRRNVESVAPIVLGAFLLLLVLGVIWIVGVSFLAAQ